MALAKISPASPKITSTCDLGRYQYLGELQLTCPAPYWVRHSKEKLPHPFLFLVSFQLWRRKSRITIRCRYQCARDSVCLRQTQGYIVASGTKKRYLVIAAQMILAWPWCPSTSLRSARDRILFCQWRARIFFLH